MKALTWQGREKVSVENVPDPRIEERQEPSIQKHREPCASRPISRNTQALNVHRLSVLARAPP